MRVEQIDTIVKTDSTTHKYDVLVSRTYAIVDTVSVLKTETIQLSGIDRQVIKDRYVKSLMRDTIYVEKDSGGTIVSEPGDKISSGVGFAIWLVIIGLILFLYGKYQ